MGQSAVLFGTVPVLDGQVSNRGRKDKAVVMDMIGACHLHTDTNLSDLLSCRMNIGIEQNRGVILHTEKIACSFRWLMLSISPVRFMGERKTMTC